MPLLPLILLQDTTASNYGKILRKQIDEATLDRVAVVLETRFSDGLSLPLDHRQRLVECCISEAADLQRLSHGLRIKLGAPAGGSSVQTRVVDPGDRHIDSIGESSFTVEWSSRLRSTRVGMGTDKPATLIRSLGR